MNDLANKRHSISARTKSKGEKKSKSHNRRLNQEIKKIQLKKYEGSRKLTKDPKLLMFIQNLTPKIYRGTSIYNSR